MISVIVPTLNEAARLGGLLVTLAAERTSHEVVVVDGGSDDGTLAVAARGGVRAIVAPRGRGQQLAAGAAEAAGDVLLFLHADCRLPAGALAQIAARLDDDPSLVGGNFRLLFDGHDPFSRWLDGFYARLRRHGLYYGDSGIFVRRTIYERLGGVRPIALMEDYDFVRRMERHGRTCCIDQPPLLTSSRRFHGRHPVAIVSRWLWIHALFRLGVSPDRLARLYNSERRRAQPPGGRSVPLSDQS